MTICSQSERSAIVFSHSSEGDTVTDIDVNVYKLLDD